MRNDGLRQLFAYLNLDWDLDYDSVDGAVADFVRSEPEAAVDGALAELDDLIGGEMNETRLKEAMIQIGCGYWPYGSGSTFQAWLPQLRDSINTARIRFKGRKRG